MNNYSLRCHQEMDKDGQHPFRTRVGCFSEMCDLVCAVAHSGTEVWQETQSLEIGLSTLFLNPVLQLSSSSDVAGRFGLLGVRERALIGHILRFYEARAVAIQPKREAKKKMRSWYEAFDEERAKYNPYCVLTIQAPSMHEKMEAVELLRDWLRQHWPEGERHLGRVV